MSYKQMTGNIISATKVEPAGNNEASAASGVWNLDDQYDYRRGANWPEAGVADPATLVENLFSTFLYVGSESSPGAIVNGIDLANEGGLVWTGQRNDTRGNHFFDTERGPNKHVIADNDEAEQSDDNTLNSFTSTGYVLGGDSGINANNGEFVSWTFRKAPKFFDVVTYTGNGSNRTIAHNLGSVPGMILIKKLNAAKNWAVYHRGVNGGSSPENYWGILNLTQAFQDNATAWQDTAPTSSVFSVGTLNHVNNNNDTYVAYLFAHETGDDSMIQCGYYAGNGNATGPVIDLGWEPQWLFVKKSDDDDAWHIFDAIRGMVVGYNELALFANANSAEASTTYASLNAEGWSIDTTAGALNQNNQNFIYVAIRRPNMATITDATEVFAVDQENDAAPYYTGGFPVDMGFFKRADAGSTSWYLYNRLAQGRELEMNASGAEGGSSNAQFDYMTGMQAGAQSSDTFAWLWKRAKGYFDVVHYTGTGSARTVVHGLGVAPEMLWVKCRSNGSTDFRIFEGNDATNMLRFTGNDASSDNAGFWNDTLPTASVFTVGDNDEVNGDGRTYVAFLFATLAGVSKIGRVDHSGSSTDVNCGFSSGARFVMLKRTDDDGDWYLWDSVRGIIAGNDPYLLINTTAASVTNTDFIDPLASGFTITGSFTDGTYMFYAIA